MKMFCKKWGILIILLLQMMIIVFGVGRCAFKSIEQWTYEGEIDWTNPIPLDKGCYYITVGYLTEEEGMTIQAFMDTSHGQDKADIIPLDKTAQEKTFELYLNEPADYFFLQTGTTGDNEKREDGTIAEKEVQIYSVTIQETNRTERAQAFLIIMLFLCMDIIYARRKRISTILSEENRMVVAGVLIITILSSIPLFVEYTITGHDLYFHLMRIEGIAKGLASGQFPVRLQTEWMNGYGYPVGVMYGDIFLYIPALLRILGFPLQSTYKVYIFTINVATTLISYDCVKSITHNKKIGLFGSLLYTLGAYRMINLYFRSAVGEYTAMAFMPLVFGGFYFLFHDEKRRRKGIIFLVIGYTAILQSHLLSFEMTLLFSGLYCILHWKYLWKNLTTLVKTAVYTILLNLSFLVPFMHYMLTMNLKVKTEKTYEMQEHGLFLSQIFEMFGWGGTGSGVLSLGVNVDMPLTQGISMLLVLFLFVAEIFVFGKKLKAQTEKGKWHEQCTIAGLMGLALGMCCWFFPWKAIANIPIIGSYLAPYQFAWRFLAVVSVMGLFLCGYAIANLQSIIGKIGQLAVITVLSTLTLVQALYFVDTVLSKTEPEKIESAACIDTVGAVTGEEYLLQEMQKTMTYSTTIEKQEAVEIGDYGREGCYYYIECTNGSEYGAYVIAPLWNYKKYVAVDSETGQEMQVISDYFGRVEVLIPGNYQGTIRITFSEPAFWRVAEMISVIMLLGGGIMLFVSKAGYLEEGQMVMHHE